MLILARKTNERIIIGDEIEVSVVDIKGDQVKLGIQAPDNVKVYRQEVFQAIQQENRSAAMTADRDLPQLSGLSNGPADSSSSESSRSEPSSSSSSESSRSGASSTGGSEETTPEDPSSSGVREPEKDGGPASE